jgi:hypothetical protein
MGVWIYAIKQLRISRTTPNSCTKPICASSSLFSAASQWISGLFESSRLLVAQLLTAREPDDTDGAHTVIWDTP